MNLHRPANRKKISGSKKILVRKSLDVEIRTNDIPVTTRPQSVFSTKNRKSPTNPFKSTKKFKTADALQQESPKLSDKKLLLINKERIHMQRHSLPSASLPSKTMLQQWYEKNEHEEEQKLQDLLNALTFSK
ncbi:unnamed protein product [Blepharisma stoltei]|uniref:Uncharacterized protein n=1 Tax=Blepharisma stoltei TaxID=1481888 RepID=A0AAU9JGM8_9CILI|nr:unnamed protein product [Blepharisma stoltei]